MFELCEKCIFYDNKEEKCKVPRKVYLCNKFTTHDDEFRDMIQKQFDMFKYDTLEQKAYDEYSHVNSINGQTNECTCELHADHDAIRKSIEDRTNECKSKISEYHKNNAISHPSHYCDGRKYEPKDVIRDWDLNFNLGSAVKYLSRAGRKDDIVQDLKKAQQFIQFEIDYLEQQKQSENREDDILGERIKECFRKGLENIKNNLENIQFNTGGILK